MNEPGFPYHDGKRLRSAIDLLNIPESERTDEEQHIVNSLKEGAQPIRDALTKQGKADLIKK